MKKNIALIAGATGQIGRSIANCLLSQDDWQVIGLARRIPTDIHFPMVPIDLTSREDCYSKLSELPNISHLIYSARYDHFGGAQESVDTNIIMLENLVDAAFSQVKEIKHIHLVHGTKYYGHTKIQRPTPYKEDDECGNFDSFYYNQQIFINNLQKGNKWTWSISRPHAFCDHNTTESRNLLLLIGIYASIMKAAGQALIFPGTEQSFHSRTQFSWLPTLARSIAWMISDPVCANQAYNVVNGDSPTWEELWSKLSAYFEMPVGPPAASSFWKLVEDKQYIWSKLIQQYELIPSNLQTIVQWPYGDYAISVEWDVVSDMSKATSHGFTEKIDSYKMWHDGFEFYREQKLIP